MRPELILIGASAGGVPAVHRILSMLPKSFQTPIAVVMHVPPQAKVNYQLSYARTTALTIKEIEDKMPIENRAVYFTPPAYHTLIEKDFFFSLSMDEPVHFSRPSIDVLFESAAWALGARVAGVLLTGANQDGAQGLQAISNAGGWSIVENPETAEVPTMPKAALRLFQPSRIASVAEIPGLLAELDKGGGL